MALSEKELKLNIARDYYTSSLSIEEMTRKYHRRGKFVVKVAEQYDYRRFLKEREYCVIKVERAHMAAARMLLENGKINFDVPEKFELTEYYESSINPENHIEE